MSPVADDFSLRGGLSHRPKDDLGFPAPHPQMRACVVVPARNEEAVLPALLAALAAQSDLAGRPLCPDSYEVLLLLNNCSDGTAAVARECQRQHPGLRLHVVQITFETEHAHVGKARQALFDSAFHRFHSLDRPAGLILTTDADSRPASDWIAQNEAEIAGGVEAVGGRITLDREEAAALPKGVKRHLIVDIGYRRALEELRHLYAPDTHDPFPRHHQHFGGSFSVTATAYGRAGGMPLHRSNEDVALYREIVDSGGRFRHSYAVRVHTSARMIGRAQGGLADAIHWWNSQTLEAAPVLVECAAAAESRLARLGIWLVENPTVTPPLSLRVTPEPPEPHEKAEIHLTLHALRRLIAGLRPLSLATRLAEARWRLADEQAEDELAA